MDSIPTDLLDLQARFAHWRANRKYVREPIPDELRSAALEMTRRYPPSLIHRVLKLDPSARHSQFLAFTMTTRACKALQASCMPARNPTLRLFEVFLSGRGKTGFIPACFKWTLPGTLRGSGMASSKHFNLGLFR